MDHDSVGGIEEFLAAAEIIGIAATAGAEVKEQRRRVNTIKGRTDCAVISSYFFLAEYFDTVYIHTSHSQLRGLLQDALIGQIRMGIFAFDNDVDIS